MVPRAGLPVFMGYRAWEGGGRGEDLVWARPLSRVRVVGVVIDRGGLNCLVGYCTPDIEYWVTTASRVDQLVWRSHRGVARLVKYNWGNSRDGGDDSFHA